jgi:hypothetical protein
MSRTRETPIPSGLEVPISLLASYLFFLLRRPVSSSNSHYLARRLQGLQSLAGILESGGDPELREIVAMLHQLTPANFSRVAGALQFQLVAAQRAVVPPHFVVSHRQPPAWTFPVTRRLLLILGPAIGIGDEMILFTLPSSIRAVYPDVEIVVMSGYRGLWDRVRAVDQREYYETHSELVRALCERSLGDFDAVIFADFEKPGLSPAICARPSMRTYVEISLGAQCALFADTHSGTIHSTQMPAEVKTNYYEVSEWLLEWLGIPVKASDRYVNVIERAGKDPSKSLRIFVSPFTSKYEASVVYWSKILASLGAVPFRRNIEFILDPGASLTTERFASALLRSGASCASSATRFRTASDPDSRTLGLAGVFSELEQCDVVLCADSFAAHAGPLFDCATLVMAHAGLESWRTPYERSFYFDMEQPISDVLPAMTRILEQFSGDAAQVAAALPSEAIELHRATGRLKKIIEDSHQVTASALNGNYDSFAASYAAVADNLQERSGCPAGLLHDADYRRTWPSIELKADDDDELRRLHARLDRWENTNLRKFLGLIAG